MTDTGRVPGEGQPGHVDVQPETQQPHSTVTAHGAYAYADHDADQPAVGDDEDLLMPGAQSAWSDGQAASGQYAVQSPQQPAPSGHASDTQSGAPRRPLHLGPPVPEQSGAVRTLADRGPRTPAPVTPQVTAPAPAAQDAPAARPVPGPEYLDVPHRSTEALPGPQLGELPADRGARAEGPTPQPSAPEAPRPGPDLAAAPQPADAATPAEAVPGPVGVVVPPAGGEAEAHATDGAAEAPAADPATAPEQAPPPPQPVADGPPAPAVAEPQPLPEPQPPAAEPGHPAETPPGPAVADGATGGPVDGAVAEAVGEQPVAAAEAGITAAPAIPDAHTQAMPPEHGEAAEPADAATPAEAVPGEVGVVVPPAGGEAEAHATDGVAEASAVDPAAGPEQAPPPPQPVADGATGEPVDGAVAEAVGEQPVAAAEAGITAAPAVPDAETHVVPSEHGEAAEDAATTDKAAPEAEGVALPSTGPETAPDGADPAGQAAAAPVAEGQQGPPPPQPERGDSAPASTSADDVTADAQPEPACIPGPRAPETEPVGTPPAGPGAQTPQTPAAVGEEAAPSGEPAAASAQADEPDPAPPEQSAPPISADAAPDDAAPPAPGYDEADRAAVHRLMRERRDIRNGFRPDPIPHDVLLRVLEAAHTAPSVGHSQPWDFVVIRSAETRRTMHELAMKQREAYAKSLPKARAKQFKELKVEAILDTPVNIVVTADPTRGGRHTLGRHTQPQMAPYSSALAVENLWLAARAEGLGVGWVSFFDEREMVRTLDLPDHLEVVAYLCIGYVDEFPAEPELMQAGWSKRRPLSWVVHEESYGRRALPGSAPHDLLAETLERIRPLDAKALGEAWERQKRMTKPAGALGMLEIISAQLCGLSRQCPPPVPEPAAVAVFAGDHGVHAQGVTPWPQEVTAQMVANFLAGGAVCNAFAHQVGAEVCVVDVGVSAELPATPGLLPRKVRSGTADMTQGPALTHEEVLRAVEVGIETARDLVAAGNKALVTGEMGIANTTASAALIAACTGADPAEVTGRGTGIDDETHTRKVEVVRRALELHRPDPADPVAMLAAIGGLEHAALTGLILGGASLRTPVILDGVSAGAAALVARQIAPEALAACIAGHRSAEPGHVAALNKLGLRPLIDLDLRLGEGTGALLALPMVQSAARAMHEVATFDSAGVTEKN